ncbi:hypothetical protein DFJ73DRAFT_957735, partial [Zopfochytrium polystomum]
MCSRVHTKIPKTAATVGILSCAASLANPDSPAQSPLPKLDAMPDGPTVNPDPSSRSGGADSPPMDDWLHSRFDQYSGDKKSTDGALAEDPASASSASAWLQRRFDQYFGNAKSERATPPTGGGVDRTEEHSFPSAAARRVDDSELTCPPDSPDGLIENSSNPVAGLNRKRLIVLLVVAVVVVTAVLVTAGRLGGWFTSGNNSPSSVSSSASTSTFLQPSSQPAVESHSSSFSTSTTISITEVPTTELPTTNNNPPSSPTSHTSTASSSTSTITIQQSTDERQTSPTPSPLPAFFQVQDLEIANDTVVSDNCLDQNSESDDPALTFRECAVTPGPKSGQVFFARDGMWAMNRWNDYCLERGEALLATPIFAKCDNSTRQRLNLTGHALYDGNGTLSFTPKFVCLRNVIPPSGVRRRMSHGGEQSRHWPPLSTHSDRPKATADAAETSSFDGGGSGGGGGRGGGSSYVWKRPAASNPTHQGEDSTGSGAIGPWLAQRIDRQLTDLKADPDAHYSFPPAGDAGSDHELTFPSPHDLKRAEAEGKSGGFKQRSALIFVIILAVVIAGVVITVLILVQRSKSGNGTTPDGGNAAISVTSHELSSTSVPLRQTTNIAATSSSPPRTSSAPSISPSVVDSFSPLHSDSASVSATSSNASLESDAVHVDVAPSSPLASSSNEEQTSTPSSSVTTDSSSTLSINTTISSPLSSSTSSTTSPSPTPSSPPPFQIKDRKSGNCMAQAPSTSRVFYRICEASPGPTSNQVFVQRGTSWVQRASGLCLDLVGKGRIATYGNCSNVLSQQLSVVQTALIDGNSVCFPPFFNTVATQVNNCANV